MPNYLITTKQEDKLTTIRNIYNDRYSKYTDVYLKENSYALDMVIDILYEMIVNIDCIEETPEMVKFNVEITKKKNEQT